MRKLLFLLPALLALTPASVASATDSKPPILYVQGIQCPAHKSCTGQPAYYDRIREIPKVGFPSKALSNGSFSDSEPVWSPNYGQIAFVRESHNGLSFTIWVMNADGSGATAVTHGNGVDVEPSWSPDGKSIVFRGNSSDGRSFDLYTVGADGAGLKDITSNPDSVSVTDPDWSSNGQLIVFERTKTGSGTGTGIYRIKPGGTGLERLEIGGADPAWSPDGKQIAFVSTGTGGLFQIWVMSAAGTGKTEVTTGTESTAPAWSPSGSQIVFLRDTQIALVNANGTGIKQLTKPVHGLAFVDTPDW